MDVDDAGIAEIESDAALGGGIPPDAQRIADKAGGRIAHLRRIAGVAEVPFAIARQIVGIDEVDDAADHLRRGIFTDFRAIRSGMEIEVNAQKAFGAFAAPGRFTGGSGKFRGPESGCREHPENSLASVPVRL